MNVTCLDLETYLIGPGAIAPKPVVLSVCSEDKHYLVPEQEIEKEMSSLLASGDVLTWHNASFDMSVLWKWYPALRPSLWEAYKKGRIACTKIRETLLELSLSGKTAGARGYFSLAGCVERYFGIDLSSFKTGDDIWRLRYSELDGVPLDEWPKEASEYALMDTKLGRDLYLAQQESKGSMGTEQLQTVAAFCLQLMTVTGVKIDGDYVAELKRKLENAYYGPLQTLLENGVEVTRELKRSTKVEFQTYAYEKKDGSVSLRNKLLQQYVAEKFPESVEYSEKTGKPSLAASALAKLPSDPIVDSLKEMAKYQKLLSSFLPPLERAVAEGGYIFAEYDPLKETGRTSSRGSKLFPSENIQQMPRDGGIREAHIARDGHVLVAIDYDSLELRAMSQACYSLFGYSKMMDVINEGQDPHCAMGAQLMSIDEGVSIGYEEFFAKNKAKDAKAKLYRQMAKAANFGFPGGLGAAKMTEYAQNYGIDNMTVAEAYNLRDTFMKTFPELEQFFAWHRLQEDAQGEWRYVTNGRLRARCDYKQAANGILLQSLSADGAKMAFVRLTEACEFGDLQGCKVLAFIHDEVILEIPQDELLEKRANVAMGIMIDAMQTVMPNVAIGVGAEAMKRWVKSGPFEWEGSLSKPPRR